MVVRVTSAARMRPAGPFHCPAGRACGPMAGGDGVRASALLLASLPPAGASGAPQVERGEPGLDDIPALIAQMPELAGIDFEVEVLHGGLTNRNYALTAPDGRKLV